MQNITKEVKMIELIEKIELVNAVTDGFPFICYICNEEHLNWDYLRIYLKGNSNAKCVHLECLLEAIGIEPEAIDRAQKSLSGKLEVDIVDQVRTATLPRVLKIERLWAIAMLNYRQPLGDKAWDLMRELTDSDVTQAIAYLTGFAQGSQLQKEKLEELAGVTQYS
jgi:hypothetical protein